MSVATNSLHDKTVLITGSAGLLGPQHAAAILNAHGSVVITDISASRLKQTEISLLNTYPPERITSLEMDVSDYDSVSQVHDFLTQRNIHINVLINNAAIDPKVSAAGNLNHSERLESFNLDDWHRQISVGLTGAAICTQIFGASMAVREEGIIINIGSDLSVIAPDQALYRDATKAEEEQPVKPLAYSVVKTGLLGLTRYTATYWGHRNVRCNMLSPGPIKSTQSSKFVELLSDRIPLGRLAMPNEFQGAIQFLCSSSSSFLNGHNLVIDGGRSIW
jgi:NAD(P)-dependent dehydrogenase (short-subunit alcohol dehydrogenase family)